MKDLESALKYFSDFATEENVPTAITTSTSGKFMVYYSKGYGSKAYDSLSDAAMEVINLHKQHKNG
jgi:hypothetical protein